MAKKKKSFTDDVDALLENSTKVPQVNGKDRELKLLNGDEQLTILLQETSDMMVEEKPLANLPNDEANDFYELLGKERGQKIKKAAPKKVDTQGQNEKQTAPVPEAPTKAPDEIKKEPAPAPEVKSTVMDGLGEVVDNVSDEYVKAYEEARKMGKSDDDSEAYARKKVGEAEIYDDSHTSDTTSENEHEKDSGEYAEEDWLDITIPEFVDIWDDLQKGGSMELYAKYNVPKHANAIIRKFGAAVKASTATDQQREAYFQANELLSEYRDKKAAFAKESEMQGKLKERIVKLATKIFAKKKIPINPWVLLVLLALLPVFKNLIRFFGQRHEFQGDDIDAFQSKFEILLQDQEDRYYEES